MNNRPSYKSRASTAAIKKPPLGVIATASARAGHENNKFDLVQSENDLKEEAEMLNIGRKQASEITDKDIMLAQYNNLFTKGNAAAQ